jgi:hypothetical protein
MKTHIDFKSALGGLAIGVLAMLAIGAGTGKFSNETYQYETGRYQIAVGANVALIIDTQTGQVWTKCWLSTSEFQTDKNFFDPKLPQPKPNE